ncbi:HEAT repeat domain-containing protein [Pedosphaera parvula]|uniref:HEAT repeat domain-containing protein n=1 Tax=Pedosphaera parvula TaxID=1032527 RepID=UPI0002D541C3|nr:HEAT repeat domain-containing protein [Pedosphaera parvula]
MLWWNLQRLKSRNPQTRRQTVEAIAATGNSKAFKPIHDALKDEDSQVRLAAAKALPTFRDERSGQVLASALLLDRNAEVRAQAALSLRSIADNRTIPALVSALKDTDHNVRWQTATTLNALGWRPESDTEFVLRSVAMGQHEDAAEYGKVAIEALGQMLLDKTSPSSSLHRKRARKNWRCLRRQITRIRAEGMTTPKSASPPSKASVKSARPPVPAYYCHF